MPDPSPGPGEVLLEVAHLGVCGTDLLLARGGIARVRPGVVVGHEFCGTVVASSSPAVPVGTRAAVEPLISCGVCSVCRAGHPHVCRVLGLHGIDRDGGGARFVAVPASRLHVLPASLSLRDAALAEPTAVAVHMVRRASVALGDRVLIFGGGPVGLLVGVVARAAGASSVVVCEPRADRRSVLSGLGFSVVDPSSVDPVAWAASSVPDGFDVTFELSTAPAAVAALPLVTRVRGTVLLGGLTDRPQTLSLSDVMLREQLLVGSRVYTSDDFARAVTLLASGAVPTSSVITSELDLPSAAATAFTPSPDAGMKTLITP